MDSRVAIGVSLLAFALAVPRDAAAEEAEGVGVVTALRGEVTVARIARTQPLALRAHDDVRLHDRITTWERSSVRVLLGNRALLTARELSVLTITEGAARATVDLQSGKVGLAVARPLMRPGEVIELSTPNVVVGVRGTGLVVEMVPAAAGAPLTANPAVITTRVYLIHGSVDVSLRNDPTAVPVHLNSLQVVEVSGNTLGTVRSLSPEAVATAMKGLTADELSRPGPPTAFLSALVTQQQTLASATGVLSRSSIRDSVDRVDNPDGLTSGLANSSGLGGGTGTAAATGTLSGAGVSTLLPLTLPAGLLTGK